MNIWGSHHNLFSAIVCAAVGFYVPLSGWSCGVFFFAGANLAFWIASKTRAA